jgi:hypothetical protein
LFCGSLNPAHGRYVFSGTENHWAPSAQVLSFWLPVALAAVCSDLGGVLAAFYLSLPLFARNLEEAAVNTAHYARVLMQVLTHYRVRN